jgi:3-phosphoglycerate kinase
MYTRSLNQSIHTISFSFSLVCSFKMICLKFWLFLLTHHKFCFLSEYMSSLLQVEVIPVDGAPSSTSFKQEEWAQNSIILFENLLNFTGEVANCKDFSQKLASGAMIFVNDSFSLSHKILASTVGITCFCYASLAGFHFEEELMKLIKITDSTRRPYIAIVIINLFFPMYM